jgi:hypothetical protein
LSWYDLHPVQAAAEALEMSLALNIQPVNLDNVCVQHAYVCTARLGRTSGSPAQCQRCCPHIIRRPVRSNSRGPGSDQVLGLGASRRRELALGRWRQTGLAACTWMKSASRYSQTWNRSGHLRLDLAGDSPPQAVAVETGVKGRAQSTSACTQHGHKRQQYKLHVVRCRSEDGHYSRCI